MEKNIKLDMDIDFINAGVDNPKVSAILVKSVFSGNVSLPVCGGMPRASPRVNASIFAGCRRSTHTGPSCLHGNGSNIIKHKRDHADRAVM
jgi:hypothetical protein